MVLNTVGGGLTPTNDSGVASYAFNDIASGTGILTFYAGRGGPTPSNYLSTVKFYGSSFIETANSGNGTGSTTVFTKAIDIDFDYLMNRQITLKGDFMMNVSSAQNTDGGNPTTYIIVKIRKWDGSTETDLSTSGQGQDITNSGALPTYKWNYNTCAVLLPKSIIKKDEYLRVTIEMWYKKSNVANIINLQVAFDPQARTTDWDTSGAVSSLLSIPIPMRIML